MNFQRSNTGCLRQILPLALLALTGTSVATDDCASPPVSAGTYDYIVVGSGPGGGILGVNLAKAGYSVLMLEAGGDSDPQSNYDPATTWDFFAKRYPEGSPYVDKYVRQTWRTPDNSYWVGLSGAPNGSELLGTYYPRGATLGGSSMINYMCTWLPSDSDWDYHYEVTGDASWKAENMHKIFQRIEHNNYLVRGSKEAAGHGFDGFFQTGMDGRINGVPDPTLEGNSVMHVYAHDFNVTDPHYSNMSALLTRDSNERSPDRDTTQSVYGLVRHVYANNTRYSSRYYVQEELANKKTNLTLSMHSLATRVVFDKNASTTGDKPRATAVEFSVGTALYSGDRRQAYVRSTRTCKIAKARREVIVAGGAFNSPQLLMLSGVGPADELKRFDIPLVHDLPGVGQHLMDNQEMPIVGSGFAGDGEATVAMTRSQHAPYGGGKERDVFLMGGQDFVFRGFFPDNQTNTNLLPPDPPQAYGVSIVKGSTGRKGYVKLRSASAFDVPEINFNLYTDGAKDVDLLAMKDIVAWVRTVYARTNITAVEPPCKKAGGSVTKTGTGTETGPNACDAEDELWIYQNTFGHHPVSTNHIGADDDPLAVLDSKFRVRGVAGLRVVDASAFARIPGVFPVAPTFIISQKASDDMFEELKDGKAIAPLV
ncbi:hypothetical protein SEUCBS140593_007652 [Sporothrix eucalyptigena]|uniref:Glucose-methanol-choline oxidoreductase N-terminal domain-containing protein n=1 Tax=Sporothrix eucalyptigena TaxID=1812306 RepID=A0ABP0CEZ4_9PEZI